MIGRLIHQKRQLKSEKNSSQKNQATNSANSENGIQNGFTDDISEIDGDIDMTTTTPSVPSVSRNEVSLVFKTFLYRYIYFFLLSSIYIYSVTKK